MHDDSLKLDSARPKKGLDIPSIILLVIGIVSGIAAYQLTLTTELNALVIVPSVVAATTGALNLVTTKGPR
ncbi:hypothetical protein F7230_04630 [Corynebacterium sp. 320]|nr:hypothetical protein F7230_04630 [Corynebacterium sp. 320]KAB1553351.1 hypothetical protein F7233_01970 [Corynebacterium sp. 321]KAB3528724.1 hypothetical protein F8354_04630 [Corynebacterium sp. 250]MCR5914159.1 hypothetical protein [Corynebacterium sp. zg254]QNP93289.1 hypothetical protein IAU67_08505 [Corynebacterium zhongnanshanii]